MISSPLFWLVLFASVPCYWLVPPRRRSLLLAAVSLGTLAAVDPLATAMVTAWLLVFWTTLHGAEAGASATAPTILVVGVLAVLAAFKYLPRLVSAVLDPAVLSVALPVGISYFSFRLVHYAIEVRRGTIGHTRLADFAAWILLFPIFTAGPIERYDHFDRHRRDRWQLHDTVIGARRIILGLTKKLLVSDLLLRPLLAGYDGVSLVARLDLAPHLPWWKVWGFLVLSYLVVYFDFAGYTDIAIGSSRLYGIEVAENFNWPLLATSPADFWRRWHMTLAGWCRSYVYMPMIGATRNPYAAVYLTFVVIGLWHAGSLNWLTWGLYHGSGVAAWQLWTRLRRRRDRQPTIVGGLCARALTFLFVTVSFAFSTTDGAGIAAAFRLIGRAFGVA